MLKEYHGYMVDSCGDIWNKKGTALLKQKINKHHGYKEVCLWYDGERHYVRSHRIIAELYCYKPDGCDVVNHLDFNIHNNDYRNLE